MRVFRFFVLAICPLFCFGQDSSLTLDACLRLAFEKNTEVLIAQKQAELAKNNTEATRYNYLPTVEANARRSYNWGLFIDPATNVLSNFASQVYSGSLYATAELFNGGKYFYLTQQQKALEEAAKWNTENVKFNIGLGIIDNYFKTRLAKEKLKLAEISIARAEAILKNVKKLIEAGTKTKLDLLAAEGNVLSAKSQAIQYQKEFELNSVTLYFATNTASFALNEPLQSEFAKKKLVENATDWSGSFPNARYLTAQNLYLQQTMRLAKAMNFPLLTVQGGFTTRSSSLIQLEVGSQFNNNLSRAFAFNLQIPIFNKFQNKFAYQSAQINYEINEAKLKDAARKSDRINALLQVEMIAAENGYASRKLQLALAEQEYAAAERLYQNGTCTLQIMLDSFTKLKETENSTMQSLVELNYFIRLRKYYVETLSAN